MLVYCMCADGNKNSTVDKNTNIQKLCATTEDFFYAQRPCIVSVATKKKILCNWKFRWKAFPVDFIFSGIHKYLTWMWSMLKIIALCLSFSFSRLQVPFLVCFLSIITNKYMQIQLDHIASKFYKTWPTQISMFSF